MNNNADMTVTFTRFPNLRALTAERFTAPWQTFVAMMEDPDSYPAKNMCPLISMCEYGDKATNAGALRHQKNVTRIHGVELDYDDGKVSPQEAHRLLTEKCVRSVIVTTASHTIDKPRWRVFAPLARPATPQQREQLVKRLDRILGNIAAPESFKLAQSFYIGHVEGTPYLALQSKGSCIDEHAPGDLLSPPAISHNNTATNTAPIAPARDSAGAFSAVLDAFKLLGLLKGTADNNWQNVTCPWVHEHTDQADNGSALALPSPDNNEIGGYRCHHSHCEGRSIHDIYAWLKSEKGIDIRAPHRHATADWAAEIQRLAMLPRIEYDRHRTIAAEALGCRLSTLDEEVRRAQGEPISAGLSGKPISFDEPDPWPEPVDGAELLNEIRKLLTTYLVLPPNADTAISLFILMTYAADLFDAMPILLLTSPEKRCGKTRTLSVVSRLVRKPLPTSNVSSAALFRTIEEYTPTFIIDEADTFLNDNHELKGVINSGFTRDTAFVMRTSGDDFTPVRFSTWCPKVIAMIKEPADTVIDRSLVIQMTRTTSLDKVQSLRHRDRFTDLRRRMTRWIADHKETLIEARPTTIPEGLDDRATDKWEPLLAIADTAGGAWPGLARQAALVLSKNVDDTSLGIALLSDLQEIFAAHGTPSVISTADILTGLHQKEERPWNEYGRMQKPLNPRQLANLLAHYKVKPHDVRPSGKKNAKGYKLEDLKDPFMRYIPPRDPRQGDNLSSTRVSEEPASRMIAANVTATGSNNFNIDAGCHVVTAESAPPLTGEKGKRRRKY